MNAQLLLFYAIWLALISGAAWTWVREGRELRECRALHAEFEKFRARARAILREYQRQAEHCPAQVYALVDAERDRQSDKWGRPHDWGIGDCSSQLVAPMVKAAVLAEESGEVARAVLERDSEHLRAELVQVAAVAVAWLESLP